MRLPLLSLILLASASAALAQGGPASVTVPQLSAPDRPGAAAAPAQADAPASALDRSGRENLVSAGAPIGEGRRTAEAAPDLSTRAQGRAVGVAAVGGVDRCEPNTPAADTELCRRRLEARAGEFNKAGAAPVTPEARLLILSDPQNQPQTFDAATRRLGGSPQADALAGSAAQTLAGAIDPARGASSGMTAAAAGGAATALPAGVPSTVVIGPR